MTWREDDADAQLDEPRIPMRCVICGESEQAYVTDIDEHGHQCLACVRAAEDRRRAMREALNASPPSTTSNNRGVTQ